LELLWRFSYAGDTTNLPLALERCREWIATFHASKLHVPNAFQHLMNKSNAAKTVTKEQRSAIFPDRKKKEHINVLSISNATSKISSVRSAPSMFLPLEKRQKQPSIDQFLSSQE
jgi:hypothetical protein